MSIYIILYGTPILRNDVTEQAFYCNIIISDPNFISTETAQLTHISYISFLKLRMKYKFLYYILHIH